ncbi:MAG: M15 family metallopeptidase [Ignavibacteriaceae bacterium]|jgi:hypothetical protein
MSNIATKILEKRHIIISIIIILFFLILIKNNFGIILSNEDRVITDSDITIKQALADNTIPESLQKNLTIVTVNYYSFDNKLHKGQVVIRKELGKDIINIFKEIENSHFPVNKVIPIIKYNWSDIASMEDNNSSAFNYRTVKNTKLISSHAKGIAIDINPLLNPQLKHGIASPPAIVYDPSRPGTLTAKSVVVKAFLKRGWQWGGYWQTTKDYQHFEKNIYNLIK